MRIYITHRHSPIGRAGQWLVAEDEGEPLFPCERAMIDGKLHLKRTSMIGIPFPTLAPYIVEPGHVKRRRRDGTFGSLSAVDAQKAIDEFQHLAEDVIDDIMEEKHQAADPKLSDKGGVFINRGE